MTDTNILLYQTTTGDIKLDVRIEDETVWLSQAQIATLFGKSRSTITEHIGNVFQEEELDEAVVSRDFRHTTSHGAIADKTQTVTTKLYNLDVIISVGYRVKSKQGTQFRIWATQRLRDYIIKGFVLNDDRFKTGQSMTYFDELQNLRGVRGRSPRIPMTMQDWASRLDAIIQLNGKELLTHAGKISHPLAEEKAALEYKRFKELAQKQDHDNNLAELANDIKRLKQHP